MGADGLSPAWKVRPGGEEAEKTAAPPLQTPPSGGIGLYIAGLGGWESFPLPLSSEIISWESTGEDVLLEALQVPLVPPVVRGTLLPRLAAPHAPLPGGCFFLFFASGCFC